MLLLLLLLLHLDAIELPEEKGEGEDDSKVTSGGSGRTVRLLDARAVA